MSNIHKTAIIEDGAIIGENVSIGAYSTIGKDVKIGDGTSIAAHTTIEGRTTIGKNNQIFSHSVIGSIPQDLKFDGEDVELIIGDNNKIREFTLFNTGTQGGGSVTRIGNDNLFMGYVHLAHDVIIGNGCIFANGATLAGHVEVDDFAVVGGLTPIHQFCKIGSYAMIAGASALSQDIPPYCLAEGNRAVIKGLNLTGLRRNFERTQIDEIKKVYKEIFESGLPIADVANEILQTATEQYIIDFANFIINTKRGIPFVRKSAQESV